MCCDFLILDAVHPTSPTNLTTQPDPTIRLTIEVRNGNHFLKFSVFLNELIKFFTAHKLYITVYISLPHSYSLSTIFSSSCITIAHQNNPDLQQLFTLHHHFSILTFCSLTVKQIFYQIRSTGFGLKKNNYRTRPNPTYVWTRQNPYVAYTFFTY